MLGNQQYFLLSLLNIKNYSKGHESEKLSL